jgi:hypothetical protein
MWQCVPRSHGTSYHYYYCNMYRTIESTRSVQIRCQAAEFTHTVCTKHAMAVNSQRKSYSYNFIFACIECDRNTVLPVLTFTNVNSKKSLRPLLD